MLIDQAGYGARSEETDLAPVLVISGGSLAPAVMELVHDLTVTAAAHVARHPPHVDGPGKAEYANINDRGVRLPGVAPPIPAVAENGKPSNVDVDTFRHIDIDIPERRQYVYHRPPRIHGGVAQIEVEISEGTSGKGPPAQPELPAPHDMTEQRRGITGGPAARTGRLSQCLRQVILQMGQLPVDPGPQRGVDSLTELLERQPARHQMLPKHDESPFAISIRGAQRGIIHDHHARPPAQLQAPV